MRELPVICHGCAPLGVCLSAQPLSLRPCSYECLAPSRSVLGRGSALACFRAQKANTFLERLRCAGGQPNREQLLLLSMLGALSLCHPPAQVLANSLAGAVLAAAACAADAGALPVEAPAAWRAALHGAFLGHYACCCADTWSSELGVLRSEPPLPRRGFWSVSESWAAQRFH